MRRTSRLLILLALVAVAPALAGCEDFDMDKLDVFGLNKKKPLPGVREPVFPNGVPGVTQGIPPEYMKGYQPPIDTAQTPDTGLTASATEGAEGAPKAEKPNAQSVTAEKPKAEKTAAVEPTEKPKPKARRKPKPKPSTATGPAKITVSPAPKGNQAPQNSPWPAQEQKPAEAWPKKQPQQAQQSPWPAQQTPQTQSSWPGSDQKPALEPWPSAPPPGTFTR